MTYFFKRLALTSYFGLMISLICWITLPEHSSLYPTSALLIIGLVPLLFPLRGMLHGKPYTHAWTGFLMLLYLSHGIGEVYSATEYSVYAALEVLFSSLVFIASIIFIRLNAKNAKKFT
ncbi:MAG: DUF2069 domain-containing protein [Gammaproteobacteria bacterium]|nr:DUF2069 domain-containing protein [Gammaproteobacteria bacterium]MDH5591921.1 DUF2069 domain-containing protein [Gammaproteobacteria bacterium]